MVYVTTQLPDFLTQSTQYERKFHGHRNLGLTPCPIPSKWSITRHIVRTTYITYIPVCLSVLYYCWRHMLSTGKAHHLTKKFDYPQVQRTSVFKSLRFPHSDPSCFRHVLQGFPGGSVVKNLPAKAGDTGLIPDPGGSHMPQGN